MRISLNFRFLAVAMTLLASAAISVPQADADALTVSATIGVVSPSAVAVNPTNDLIYVSNAGGVSVINGATNTVTTTIGVGNAPGGVAVNPTTNTIYVANTSDRSVSVINGLTNTVTATIIGGSHPGGVAVNPTTNLVYITNGCCNETSDSVSVINGATNTVAATIGVGASPSGVAVNPTTNLIYVVNSASYTVTVIDGATNTVTATIGVGAFPSGVAVNPTTNLIYVANTYDNSVSVINGNTNTVTATIGVGKGPGGIAVNPTTNFVYVANSDGNSVSVINGNTNTVAATIGVGNFPGGVAVNPTTNSIYVANSGANSVLVFPPSTVPQQPTSVSATSRSNTSSLVSWSAPGFNGGSPITSYTVTSSPGGKTCTWTSGPLSCTVGGLTNGQGYTFTVVASNFNGDSASSVASSTATPSTVPQQPTSVSATWRSDTSSLVSWSAPGSNGGSAVTSFTVTSSPGGKTCTWTSGPLSCTVGGLTNGQGYTFTVVAKNGSGLSFASAPSLLNYQYFAKSLTLKVLPPVVKLKATFTLVAYGAPAGAKITIAVPGQQGVCTANAAGQCVLTKSINTAGAWTAIALSGKATSQVPFYALSNSLAVAIPLTSKHGKTMTVSVSHAPPSSPIQVRLSDGRTLSLTTNAAGSGSVQVATPRVGLLTATVVLAGVVLKSSTVLVS